MKSTDWDADYSISLLLWPVLALLLSVPLLLLFAVFVKIMPVFRVVVPLPLRQLTQLVLLILAVVADECFVTIHAPLATVDALLFCDDLIQASATIAFETAFSFYCC
jgi:hypothetical protein